MADETSLPPTQRGRDRKTEVWEACRRVCSRGKKPSLSEVRAEGVKGSDGDVHTYIKSWYEDVFASYLGRASELDLPNDVALLFREVYARCKDLAASQFDQERLRLQTERNEAEDLADALRQRAADLEVRLTERTDAHARSQLEVAEARDALAGVKTEIGELLRVQRTRDNDHEAALAGRDKAHARALEDLRTDHAAAMEDKNLTIARQQAELARIDDQFRELQREKAQAVEAQRTAEAKAIEAQRQAEATIAQVRKQCDAEAAKARDLEAGMKLESAECERLRAALTDLERRLQRERAQQTAVGDRPTPRFLRRIRGQS